jgi:GNAT superfamily N-acetyltransferase
VTCGAGAPPPHLRRSVAAMPDTDLARSLARAGVIIRPATIADIDMMVELRVRMFREMGWSDESRFEIFVPAATAHMREGFSADSCNGFVAEETAEDGSRRIVATVALVWQQVAPTVRNIEGRVAYVMGMYVVPEWRRRGIARELMSATITCAAKKCAPLITLHASDEGRVLYEKLGFVSAPEMRLFTEHSLPGAWVPAYDAD